MNFSSLKDTAKAYKEASSALIVGDIFGSKTAEDHPKSIRQKCYAVVQPDADQPWHRATAQSGHAAIIQVGPYQVGPSSRLSQVGPTRVGPSRLALLVGFSQVGPFQDGPFQVGPTRLALPGWPLPGWPTSLTFSGWPSQVGPY